MELIESYKAKMWNLLYGKNKCVTYAYQKGIAPEYAP
eukprot:CAMPEP_0175167276 /NCGR_PEP_ID=MMETSP0087-20121206/28242_1 /TAXON_ID=136419 /ORGANISM="Unknown Unknown, Strain D1" /LENGTH=36 /DNA_ID= /DNA_START= /DNA_END= /DNA_ORIENTATION=